jgi:hypothetical protein
MPAPLTPASTGFTNKPREWFDFFKGLCRRRDGRGVRT